MNERVLFPLSRTLVAALFLASGIDKLLHRERAARKLASLDLPRVRLLVAGAALTEIAGAAALLLGRQHRLGAASLAAYLVPTTALFHRFWKHQGAERDTQMIQFLKNAAIMGGLVELARHSHPRHSGQSVEVAPGVERRDLTETNPETIEIIEISEVERVA